MIKCLLFKISTSKLLLVDGKEVLVTCFFTEEEGFLWVFL